MQPIHTIGFNIVPITLVRIIVAIFLQKVCGAKKSNRSWVANTGPTATIATGTIIGMPIKIKNKIPTLKSAILHLPQSSLGLSCRPGQPNGLRALKWAVLYSLPQSQHH